MSLSRKVSLIIGLIVLLSCAISLWTQRAFILPSFLELERETAARNAERALQAINREIEQLGPSAFDWAYWTDTYEFARGEYPEYEADNFGTDNTLEAMKLNYIGFYDTAGGVILSRGWNLDESAPVSLGELTDVSALPATHPLLVHSDVEDKASGIVDTPQGAMMVYSAPILTNEQSGPPAGSVVMGRLLDEAALTRLADQTRLALTLDRQFDAATVQPVAGKGGPARTETVLNETPERWRADTVLLDLDGQPLLNLSVDTGRDISARGEAAVRLSLISLAAMGLMTLALLLLALRVVLLRPLDRLTAHATGIGEDPTVERRLRMRRGDEIGTLAGTLDAMLDRLAEARRELVAQSYRSGIAETASGVLHNIGNAITPLNVRLSYLQGDLASALVDEIEQATRELADPDTPPERAADLRAFVDLAAAETAALVRRCRTGVASASAQLTDVQRILDDQERFSRAERVMEGVDAKALIDDAYATLAPAMQRAMRIEIEPDVAACAPVHGSRAALLQVVTNLLVNAAEAIAESGSELGRLRVSVARADDAGRPLALLSFTDNGPGIETEHLQQVFGRGFSTKHRQGSGLGLHWSANTVRDFGGSLSMENVGSGHGCRVSLVLPLHDSAAPGATGTEG